MIDTAPLMLTRAQRVAVRGEVRLTASGWGDLEFGFAKGNRDEVRRAIAAITAMADLFDAIGWTEQPDAPDAQPVDVGPNVASWAARDAEALAGCLRESIPPPPDVMDRDLDALSGLRVLAGAKTA